MVAKTTTQLQKDWGLTRTGVWWWIEEAKVTDQVTYQDPPSPAILSHLGVLRVEAEMRKRQKAKQST